MSNIWVDLYEGRVFRDKAVRNRSGEYVVYPQNKRIAYYIKPYGRDAHVRMGLINQEYWSFSPQEAEVLYNKVFREIAVKDVDADKLLKACAILHKRFVAHMKLRMDSTAERLKREFVEAVRSKLS